MHESYEAIAKASSIISFSASGGLIAGGLLDFINQNAAFFGFVLGLMTFFVNWYYKHRAIRIEEMKIELHDETKQK